jgi:ABC-2 type transport system ATP-binding protein
MIEQRRTTADDLGATVAVGFAGAAKSYGAVRAVEGLDLVVRCGETVALLGPNGAGKSTSIGMLLGLVAPDAGAVRVFGETPEVAVRSGRIGAMLQEAGLPKDVKVGELVAFVRRLYPSPLPVQEIMATAGLADLAGRRGDELSGGQTQRLRFACALAGDPDLLVLDEPTAAMDVAARRAFWESIKDQAAAGRTVLFSTHYLEEADANADRVVVISRGRIVTDGTGAEIKASAGGSIVSFDLEGEPTEGLDLLPGVVAVEVRAGRVTLRTADSDATVAALFTARGFVRGLEVTGAGLEDAFLALTSDVTASSTSREEN